MNVKTNCRKICERRSRRNPWNSPVVCNSTWLRRTDGWYSFFQWIKAVYVLDCACYLPKAWNLEHLGTSWNTQILTFSDLIVAISSGVVGCQVLGGSRRQRWQWVCLRTQVVCCFKVFIWDPNGLAIPLIHINSGVEDLKLMNSISSSLMKMQLTLLHISPLRVSQVLGPLALPYLYIVRI